MVSRTGAVWGDGGPPLRAHSICGFSLLLRPLQTGRFLGCWELQLGNRIQVFFFFFFLLFYFHDFQYIFGGLQSLGPFVAVDNIVNPA